MQHDTPGDIPRDEVRDRLAAIIESSDDAIASKTLDGVVTSWNKAAERIFGWTSAEIVGKPITLIIPTNRLDEEPEILRRIQAGERVDHFETVRQTKDGRLIDVSVTISPIRDLSGRIVGASKIARDITLQKRFEQELTAAKEAAESANRAKDQFLSVLSHELRTPLTPVLAAVSEMEIDDTVPPHLREQVEMIRRNVETEARLVDDLLDLTRIARGLVRLHFEVVDAHAALHAVFSMFRHEIEEKRLTIAITLRADEHHVWADPGRFQQMLLNLLSNAVKFTPPDGTITARTANENGTVAIEIADTGVGIDPELLPRLFRPFEQGDQTHSRRFGGLGLGLSIVKSLVELHRGCICVASEGRNRGSSFTLRIPSLRADYQSSLAASNEAGKAERRLAFRVLLVEDHADTRQVLKRLLTNFGCQVTTAGSVREAVAAAERQTFDVLVSDLGLPDGSGTDVMRHMARQNVRGIALSGFGQDEDLRRSREAGFETHLIKPVNLQTLQAVLRGVAT